MPDRGADDAKSGPLFSLLPKLPRISLQFSESRPLNGSMKSTSAHYLCAMVFLLGLGASLVAEPMTLTSKDGKTIAATILSVTGDNVQLKRADGVTFNVPVNRFDPNTQMAITKWQEENKGKVPPHLRDKKPRMDIRVNTGRTSRDGDQFSGFIDERKQKIAFKIELENQDAVYPIDTVNVTLLVVGESPITRQDAVVYKEVFKGVKLPLNEDVTINAKPFELWYDDEGAMYGHKYEGYFVLVQDAEGKVLGEKTIPSSAAKYIDAIKTLNAGDTLGRGFSKAGTTSLSGSVKMR